MTTLEVGTKIQGIEIFTTSIHQGVYKNIRFEITDIINHGEKCNSSYYIFLDVDRIGKDFYNQICDSDDDDNFMHEFSWSSRMTYCESENYCIKAGGDILYEISLAAKICEVKKTIDSIIRIIDFKVSEINKLELVK